MKKLITICLLIAMTFSLKAQDIDVLLTKLNSSTKKTERLGLYSIPGYSVNAFFTNEGCTFTYSNKNGKYTYYWKEVAGLALTSRGRVYLAFDNKTFEYITPKDGVRPSEVLDLISQIAYQSTNKEVRIYASGSTVKDELDASAQTGTQNTQHSTGKGISAEIILLGILTAGLIFILIQ